MDHEEKEKMDKHLGRVCWENHDFVVRCKTIGDGELRVVVNRKISGREAVTRSHVPGETTLTIER